MTAFTHSRRISWINNIITAYEAEVDFANQQYRSVAYEWVS